MGDDSIEAAGDFSQGPAVQRTLQTHGQIAATHFDESLLQVNSLCGLHIENTLVNLVIAFPETRHHGLDHCAFSRLQQGATIRRGNTWQLFGGIPLVTGKIVQRIGKVVAINALPLPVRNNGLISLQGDGHKIAFEQRLYRIIQLADMLL
ncbi:hypothetical protein D3C84_800870 [compost metagenome]